MRRFLTAWITTALIYIFGGLLVVGLVTLVGFVAFDFEPARLRNLWLYGPFSLPSLSQHVFLDPGTPPASPRHGTPEQSARYRSEQQQYFDRLAVARRRSDVVAGAWMFTAITTLALFSTFVRRAPDDIRNA